MERLKPSFYIGKGLKDEAEKWIYAGVFDSLKKSGGYGRSEKWTVENEIGLFTVTKENGVNEGERRQL